MGAAQLELTQLDLGQPQDIVLELKDPARPKQHLGEIYLSATLWPRNQQEKEQVLCPCRFCTVPRMKRGRESSGSLKVYSFEVSEHEVWKSLKSTESQSYKLWDSRSFYEHTISFLDTVLSHPLIWVLRFCCLTPKSHIPLPLKRCGTCSRSCYAYLPRDIVS